MKLCNHCKVEKDDQHFSGDDRLDGKRKQKLDSYCKNCRREMYYRRRYREPCTICTLHRALWGNGICKFCNEARGLRQCCRCKNMLPILLGFNLGRSHCKSCS